MLCGLEQEGINNIMKKIILASNNIHKINEIKQLLKEISIEISSLKDEDIDIDVIEDGETFKENAKKKASEIVDFLKKRGDNDFVVMADDSGLEVDYLKGEPGIYSARYAGKHGNDKENNEKLLEKLKGVTKDNREAKFICEIILMDSDKKCLSVKGEVKGIILEELSEEGGFGYDPLFYYEPLKKSFSELDQEDKNKVSHRGIALSRLKNQIKDFI
ncbi:dITP/XTP pyrophosphatase [Clostridium vincentii]|uniref:dITP/XTP pyrophosphatase n=2 Tax=Clostridium vincentii TaxID=52704 RepID=A0A2T0BA03_9CLOT|nr:dITP/XTP pyrophosphatase [Clostridium vincentii]